MQTLTCLFYLITYLKIKNSVYLIKKLSREILKKQKYIKEESDLVLVSSFFQKDTLQVKCNLI